MTNLSIVSQGEVSENQVTGSRVAKTQQPGAERLKNAYKQVNPDSAGLSVIQKEKLIDFINVPRSI